MADSKEQELTANDGDGALGPWIRLGFAVGAVLAGAAYYVSSTPGTTSLDKFAASIAGLIGGGFLLIVIIRLFSHDED